MRTIDLSRFFKGAITILLISFTITLSAQVDQTAELKVTINDILSFTLDDTNPTLVFDESADFINGISYTASSAGTVTSSGAYSVSVKAEKNHLEDSSGNKIKVNSITLEATGTDLGTLAAVALKTSGQDIVSGAPAAISKTFDLKYSTTGNDSEFIGKPAGDYTVELTFTATLD